ncbi:hypothetical protein DFH11DRAFT_1577792 [Phellopilus nigrolimitatus]|nr:hypothetical protein DFH11DRAFT_1577792 [Phellopilus nigrolimitatus]
MYVCMCVLHVCGARVFRLCSAFVQSANVGLEQQVRLRLRCTCTYAHGNYPLSSLLFSPIFILPSYGARTSRNKHFAAPPGFPLRRTYSKNALGSRASEEAVSPHPNFVRPSQPRGQREKTRDADTPAGAASASAFSSTFAFSQAFAFVRSCSVIRVRERAAARASRCCAPKHAQGGCRARVRFCVRRICPCLFG